MIHSEERVSRKKFCCELLRGALLTQTYSIYAVILESNCFVLIFTLKRRIMKVLPLAIRVTLLLSIRLFTTRSLNGSALFDTEELTITPKEPKLPIYKNFFLLKQIFSDIIPKSNLSIVLEKERVEFYAIPFCNTLQSGIYLY